VRAGRARERHVHHAGLHHRELVLGVDRDDAVEPVEPDDHHVVGERAPRQPVPAPRATNGTPSLREHAHHAHQLVARAWQHHQRRLPMVAGQPVRVVDPHLGGPVQRVPRTHDPRQLAASDARSGAAEWEETVILTR
jgi:hypothetical protein